MIRAINDEFNEGAPQFLKIPATKVTLEAGKTITLETVTSGDKPIGKDKIDISFLIAAMKLFHLFFTIWIEIHFSKNFFEILK